MTNTSPNPDLQSSEYSAEARFPHKRMDVVEDILRQLEREVATTQPRTIERTLVVPKPSPVQDTPTPVSPLLPESTASDTDALIREAEAVLAKAFEDQTQDA